MKKTVFVIGDVMLDHYVNVETHRKAPEADIPVWDQTDEQYRLGGAANVANNVKSLGTDEVDVYLAGIFRKTELNQALMLKQKISTVFCVHGHTMEKHRYVHEKEIIFRSDSFLKFSPSEVGYFEHVFTGLDSLLPHHVDALIFSDYDKGTVTPKIVDYLRRVFDNPFTVVDSKRYDLRMFSGSDILKVNSEEFGLQVTAERDLYDNRSVCSMFKHCVVTHGKDPTQLVEFDPGKSVNGRNVTYYESFQVPPNNAVDVTGCGDTHTAALTFALLKGKDIREAIKFANVCAANVVRQMGTSVAQPLE